MKNMGHYLVASMVSITLICGAAWFCVSVRDSVNKILDEQQAFDGGQPDDSVGLEVNATLAWRIGVADLLANFWFVWIPLVLEICFGTASLFRS